uniref:Uncharacterized protein n=1 Tax=Tanacetum cinerariifolium TaxID=118510 RepID=A0A6L2JA48_TANCI|nr:hypothetical protein [Tanacetum cinerariifolium]
MADQQEIQQQSQQDHLEIQQQSQQDHLDDELVPIDDQVQTGLSNYKITLEKSQPDLIYKICLASEDYLNYLAKSTRTQLVKVKGKGKGLITKKGVEVVVEMVRTPKKRRSEIVIEETGQSEEVADTEDSEETEDDEEEPQLTRRRQTGVFIVRKASKEDFILKQCSKGPGEGSSMAPEILDGPSDSFSSSSSESEDSKGFFPIDDEANPDKSDAKKKTKDAKSVDKVREDQAIDEQARNVQAKDSFINDNPDVSLTDVLKDQAEIKIQLMVEVDRISKINHSEAINKFVQAHLKKVLSTVAPGIGKLKPKKVAKQSMPKYFNKPFDDVSLKKYDLKQKLISLMSKSKSFNTHLAHQTLNVALMDSLLVDEDDMDNRFVDPPSLKKICHDDQDPHVDVDKDTNKRRKDYDVSSSKKRKDKEASSKEDDEELAHDDGMDAEGVTHDDAAPKQDRSKWFKQVVVERPKTPEPEWHKEPCWDLLI